jgi:SOS-response transcriptional repressor LexA
MTAPVIGMRLGLTARQRKCFDAIEAYMAQHRKAPTYREIAAIMGTKALGNVVPLVAQLRDRGWINYRERCTRSIVILEDGGAPSYVLPASVEAVLRRHCAASGDHPSAVVADAVALFLDEAERDHAA